MWLQEHPAVPEGLDLVEEDEQFTHMLTLEDAINGEELLSKFSRRSLQFTNTTGNIFRSSATVDIYLFSLKFLKVCMGEGSVKAVYGILPALIINIIFDITRLSTYTVRCHGMSCGPQVVISCSTRVLIQCKCCSYQL